MRLLIQRVSSAQVSVEDHVVGSIGHGLMVLVGIHIDDQESDIIKGVQKLIGLRIFEDEEGKMNLDIKQTGGEILLVSQFTLYGNMTKGNRPSFIDAAPGPVALPLFNQFVTLVRNEGNIPVQTGQFGANMQVKLVNEGPVTLLWESR